LLKFNFSQYVNELINLKFYLEFQSKLNICNPNNYSSTD
jgi:hypothetical protein